MDLYKRKESFDLNKYVISQKSSFLVSTKNGRIKIIEAAKIRNDKFCKRLMSSSLDADFEYHHMDNKCYKNYVHKKAFERINANFLVDY